MTADTNTSHPPRTAPLLGPVEWICIALCLVWLVLGLSTAANLGVFASPGNALEKMMALIAIIFPVAIIAMVCAAARQQRLLRAEAQGLRQSVAHLQHAVEVEARARRDLQGGVMEEKLDALAKSAAQTETALATFVTSRKPRRAAPSVAPAPAPAKAPAEDNQADLFADNAPKSGGPATPVDQATLIAALHFPSDANDTAGFDALRKGVADRRYRPLIYAAQDVLTRLAKDDIYMDSLTVDRTRPEVWRKFAEGERGPLVSSVGGIRDRQALALASRAIKSDPIFRDTAHQFVQKFDGTLTALAGDMDDSALLKLTDTRSARAFMLVGRVLGLFS